MTSLDSFPTAYTPLESLLLFQALRVDGVKSISFTRISDQLQSISLVHDDPTYDRGRLSPDALRQLYLHLLKDEVKQDVERQVHGDTRLVNGDGSPGSRKRKAASPSLPTVNEAAKHAHLIPQLVTRLYARYRENVVRHLRDDERKFTTLTREIGEIEAGRWDERLQRPRSSSGIQGPKPSSTAYTQSSLARSESGPSSAQPAGATRPDSSQNLPEDAIQAPPQQYSQARIDAVINHGPEPDDSSGGHRRQSSNTVLPPLSEMAPQTAEFDAPPKMSYSASSQVPPTPMPNMNYSPAEGGQYPFAPQTSDHKSGSASLPHAQPHLPRPTSSHRPILPPVPGMKHQPLQSNGSPNMHGHSLQPHPHHLQHVQQRPQHQISPTGSMSPSGFPLASLPPQQSPGYYSQPQPTDRRTPYSAPQQQHTAYQSPVQHAGGFMVPSYHAGSSDPTHAMQQQGHGRQSLAQASRPLPHMQNAHHAHHAPTTAPRTAPRANPRLVADILSALATPTRANFKPLWRSDFRPSTLAAPVLKASPAVEPLSPNLGRSYPSMRDTHRSERFDASSKDQSVPVESRVKTRVSKRKRNVRDRSPHSVVSSLADDSARRTRSQSVSTVAGLHPASDDRPESRNGVKIEPSTPADYLDDAEPMTAPAATPASRPMTRNRRGTLTTAPLHAASKRKRQESPATAVDDTEDASTPPPRSDKVIATRNFAKMASALMNDIYSHKNAYRFERPVKNKEAPGYSAIVYQPQDLKSIRAAITAGTRAVTAATNNSDSPAATPTASVARGTDASPTVELQRSVDVIPPKAIVNGAQLEKELMRMFANAFMFNPGDDGVAGVTKEFFQDVEQKISEWRNIEREKTGVDGEDEGKVKRRKL